MTKPSAALKIERVPIASIKQDPANARRHPQRNIDDITSSLRRFGQQKPLVVDGDGVVRAGNGTLAAALALGWTEVDVVRTGLKGHEATAYALADNQSALSATYDEDVLRAQLAELEAEGISREELGFDATPDEVEPIEVHEIDTSEVADRFWLSVTGPLPKQPEVLAELQKALGKIGGLQVDIGTTDGH